ncbi:hypothetical protein D7030_07765 [Flavobacteriaceae bacterium AU392]|nr:hypothetical protein D1817_00650 [Flavobacteriaceae bacterium]RKM85019.1 hypothetical protein D7030_07765 [Flavobacteriaceae bacterium AU392]
MTKYVFAFFILCISFNAFSQENTGDLRIFIDCDRCDNEYLRQNLGNVQFVRDQNLAQVHLFFTTQRNGSGGTEFVIDFIGKETFTDLKDQLSFNTDATMTNDEIRNLTLRYIKLGLVRYWVKAGKIEDVTINVKNEVNTEEEKEEVDDPWNYWVFRLGANGFFNGQETNRSSNVNLNVSARRVTEKNKLFIRASFNENRSVFTFDGEDIINTNNSKFFGINDAISISQHWSIGAFANVRASTFSNIDLSWNFRPAIEYNFFKYSESAKKQLTLSYRNGIRFNDYEELTVFGETSEYLWEHEISLGASVNQKWGNISGEASFEQFLQDLTLNELSFRLNASVRLFKGFNFNVGGSYSITRNLINLAAGDVTLEELLLQQQQLQSGFDYFVSVGFSYTFGSIYNTIVNPRFGF